MLAVDTIIAIAIFGVIAAIFYFVFATFLVGAGYQPTPARAVDAMLRLAEVGSDDTVYDLGAGTGAIVFRAAEERGARVVGIEVEPIRVAILRWRRRRSPAKDRIELRRGNLFSVDLTSATVVAVFLWPGAMARLEPRLRAQLQPGARVVSHYHLLAGYAPSAVDEESKVYLYRWPPTPTADATGGSGTRTPHR